MNLDLLIAKAKAKGISEIEIFSQHKKGLSISLFQNKVDKYNINDTLSLHVRALYKGKMGSVSVENTSDTNIDFIINKLIDNATSITSKEEEVIFEGSKTYPTIEEVKTNIFAVEPSVKIELLRKLENKIKSLDARITNVANCGYNESNTITVIKNSKGLNLAKVESYAFVTASAVAKENDDVKSYFDYILTNDFAQIDIDKLANKIVTRVISLLNAQSVPSKTYPVIFENKVFAELLKAFEPMFSGESALKNITLLKEKVGQKIVSEKVTLIDDPLLKTSIFKQTFDDEGVACQRKEVVTNGVLNTLLHNLKTAKALNVSSTGNGFNGGVGSSNFYLQPGNTSLDKMISSVKEGLLITSIAGIHAGVNPVSGSFNLQSSGFLIEEGKITRPVTLIVVSGNFLDMLNEVEMIGNDLEFTYELTGSPSIKITSLPVSGK